MSSVESIEEAYCSVDREERLLHGLEITTMNAREPP